MKRTILAASCATALLTACTSSHSDHPGSSGMAGMQHATDSSSGQDMPDGMAGMNMASGNGLQSAVDGYQLKLGTMPDAGMPMAGMPMPVTFTIQKDGKAVTDFDEEQTKTLHFYLIRSDLTGFQHLHPTMSPDGTWTVTPAALTAGSYRIYTQFAPHGGGEALVTSLPLTLPGTATTEAPLPAPAETTTVDGYTVKIAGSLKHGAESPITVTISKGGRAITDLQPYLGVYAHVTAIHAGDLAFAHLHPNGGTAGGPTLKADAELPDAGNYRAFIQFQTAGTLHTAAITLSAS